MDVLWGKNPHKPEDGVDYNDALLKRIPGDLLVISPTKRYGGPQVKPKGQWIEVHPDKQFISHIPLLWANSKIEKTVGILAGFDFDTSMALAQMGFDRKLQPIDVAGNIAIVNGPNLNLLGQREPEIYGKLTLEQIFEECKIIAPNARFVFRQSNSEGEIVTLIQQLRQESDAIIINAGAYTHTSVAIHDALRSFDDQIIELHVSNPHQREKFRHTSYIAPVSHGMVAGFGPFGYKLALIGACMRL